MSFYLPSSRNCVHQNSAERQEHFEVIYFSFDKFYNESYSWCSIWIIVSDREDVLLTTPADRLNPTPRADPSLPAPQMLCRHSQPPQLCGVSAVPAGCAYLGMPGTENEPRTNLPSTRHSLKTCGVFQGHSVQVGVSQFKKCSGFRECPEVGDLTIEQVIPLWGKEKEIPLFCQCLNLSQRRALLSLSQDILLFVITEADPIEPEKVGCF